MKETDEEKLKRSVLLVAASASFLIPFLGSAVNMALPSIGEEFNANAVGLSWVVSSYLLSSAVFLLPFGRLGDIIGRKRVFSCGIILFTFSSTLIVFSSSIASLIALRILQGFSSAMIFGTSLAILTSVFPQGERGRAMGISVTATYFGLSAGPVIGGLLIQYFGWRSIFIILILIGLISIYLVFSKMKGEWAEARGEKFDWPGSVIYGISLSAFIYGFSKLPSKSGLILLITGVVMGFFFVLFEKKSAFPVFSMTLVLRNRVLTFSGLASLIHYSATSATGFFLSLYLQYVKGLDARDAGLIMITQPLVMAFLSPLAGRLSDRKNPGIIASIGMGLTGAGLVLFCFVNASTPIYQIVMMLLITGIGFAFFSTPNSNVIMSSVEKRYLGIASGVVGTMRIIGQMMSMGVAMMLISIYIGKNSINPDTFPGLIAAMKTGFFVFSILSVFGIFASLARNKSLSSRDQDS